MRWEELTGDEFPQIVAAVQGVGLLSLSCIERHAHYLPLGTDMYIGRERCNRAAALKSLIFASLSAYFLLCTGIWTTTNIY